MIRFLNWLNKLESSNFLAHIVMILLGAFVLGCLFIIYKLVVGLIPYEVDIAATVCAAIALTFLSWFVGLVTAVILDGIFMSGRKS